MSKQKSFCLSAIALGAALGLNSCDDYAPANKLQVNKAEQARVSYPSFRFPNELEGIAYHANRVGVELPLLLAIREAENGRQGLQFGIIPTQRYANDTGFSQNAQFHQYESELSKQVSWSAWTIRKNYERFNSLSSKESSKYTDFIDFLGDRYAPTKAKNDPRNLNSNWKRNVRARYNLHKGN